ncbi:hypothetical protein EYF80_007051 [Liparis tanakae]|uniref:Uncharacterized protein n=1 Tax=Liparis tanakae TaxID=230148 RepID=A0A4Z2IZB0_9TELE|nr:hypothetical protein EYF80_007051 [Liparis tanakae]
MEMKSRRDTHTAWPLAAALASRAPARIRSNNSDRACADRTLILAAHFGDNNGVDRQRRGEEEKGEEEKGEEKGEERRRKEKRKERRGETDLSGPASPAQPSYLTAANRERLPSPISDHNSSQGMRKSGWSNLCGPRAHWPAFELTESWSYSYWAKLMISNI